MLLSRCAWHRRFFGRSKFLGVVSFLAYPFRIEWSDGLCVRCRRRLRADIQVQLPHLIIDDDLPSEKAP